LLEIKPNILIVDDERGLRVGTARLLEEEGYEVTTAENGYEGIALGTSCDFDIAIIDMKMPDIDGLDVLSAIKKVFPNTICIIATAFASYDTAIEATRLGAFSYIPKPFTPDELIYQLKQGFQQRTLLLEAARLKKEREEQLLEIANEKSRLNTIIKSINDGVLVFNKEGKVVYYNSSALKYLDLKEIKIGEDIPEKIPAEISKLLNKYITSESFIEKSYTTQIEILPRGQLIVEAVCSPIKNPDKTLAGVVVVIRNITELKKVELIKSQFVSMVAHELKTPMAAVQGFLNIMLDGNIPLSYEKQQEYLSRSVVRLRSLLDLVNDLLDISRMELKTKQREIVEIDTIEVVKSTLLILELEIQKKGIKINLDFEENPPAIKADLNEITRVITNILSNAIKYNIDRGEITVSLKTSPNYLIIKIADNGIGMKPEEKANLFQEFYRAKNEKTRSISGTGLGLNIVKRIVESYSGKIEVDSEFGKGTAFTILFPINT
jgi:two-component system, OmpR family, phosphate regulon sensor histidine kinase PhoR